MMVYMDTQNIKCIICLDVTGSMQQLVNVTLNTIQQTINDLQRQYVDKSIQIGLVLFKDLTDENQFTVLPATGQIDIIKQVLKDIKVDGGDDHAEDLQGAVEQALKLEWNINDLNSILLYSDAPDHGENYCRKNNDNHQEIEKKWDQMLKEIKSKNIIFTHFLLKYDKDIQKTVQSIQELDVETSVYFTENISELYGKLKSQNGIEMNIEKHFSSDMTKVITRKIDH